MKKLSIFTAIILGFQHLCAVELPSTVQMDQNTTVSAIRTPKGVFGEHLFSGNFTKTSQHMYNPEYRLAIGDVVTVKMWGAFEYEQQHTIDSQGNIFIPRVGTVKLLGVKNGDLVPILSESVKKVYSNNVYVYADMGAYQNVSIFVTGNVNKPGLYQGLSSDSLLQFLDKASGINSDHGSFRSITVLRDNKPFKKIDLYEFMLEGKMEMFAFRTGDVILVDSIGSYVSANGEVLRPYRFEYKTSALTLADLAKFSGIKPTATNALVKSFTSENRLNVESYPKAKFNDVKLKTGDEVEFMPDHSAAMMQVKIEGEHEGLHTIVIPKGTTLGELRKNLKLTPQSNGEAIQILRKSVAEMQKKLIESQLRELETLALTTASSSPDEAKIRSEESKAVLEFIDRAKKVEPRGQIVISNRSESDSIVLQDGDALYIPTKNNIVIVQGEVALPGAFTYVDGYSLDDYIDMAGDMSSRANKERVLVIRANGKAEKYDASLFALNSKPRIEQGDSVLILPKAEDRTLMTAGVVTQILYQIAIAAKVVLDL
jgi:protein involved in polysaccharide export with SLBB domain